VPDAIWCWSERCRRFAGNAEGAARFQVCVVVPPTIELPMRLAVVLSLLPLLLACNAPAPRSSTSPWDAALRSELQRRYIEDQAVRDRVIALMQSGKPFDAALGAEMQTIDSSNTAWLREAVARHGWPDRAVVGDSGATAAFLIVQHADRDTAFQAAMLPAIVAAHERGQIDGESVALLTDRLAAARGQPQIYGTQSSLENGRLVLKPIRDSANVDARRAQMGLPSLAEYMRVMDSIYLGERASNAATRQPE
jgi:hypothetical protein